MTTVPGREEPVATAGGASLPAGECGVEDQVSRPGPSGAAGRSGPAGAPVAGGAASPAHLALVGPT
ncbi:MAG: collagen-like protein, partial [Acidimicrobiales bacterium]